jgi:hypothetical protein
VIAAPVVARGDEVSPVLNRTDVECRMIVAAGPPPRREAELVAPQIGRPIVGDWPEGPTRVPGSGLFVASARRRPRLTTILIAECTPKDYQWWHQLILATFM